MVDNFITFIILYITAFILGMFVEWVISRPEPQPDPVDLDKTLSELDNNKIDMEDWKECIKQCEAYYKDNGKIWDSETAVIDVKKPKRIKHGKCTTNPNDPGKPYSEFNENVKLKKKKKKNDKRKKKNM